jgi:phosphatidylglycerophosphate synthase
MLQSMEGVTIVTDETPAPPGTVVVCFRGDYLYHGRLLRAVLELDDDFALYERNSDAVIAVRTGVYEPGIFEGGHEAGLPRRIEPDDLVNPYDNRLKKYEPARAWQIRADNRDELEQELFSSSYKGVTDLVTKWVWPAPARWATKVCARLGIRPNHVTGFSVALAVLAGAAFWYGHFVTGLALGWFMTFLDTVDGKLARVTLTSSRFGDLLDHSLDLIHPPLWYIAWGVGAGADSLPLVAVMFAGYIGGRLCEGAFQLWVAPFSIFLWRPADSLNRLITARRNPNLIILTAGLFAGQPAAALVVVVAWHALSTLFLLARLGVAWKVKRDLGPLEPWLAGVGPRAASGAGQGNRLALKIFT